MNTKTVKEKVAEIIYKGIPFVCSEEIYHEVATKIDKLYRKEVKIEGMRLYRIGYLDGESRRRRMSCTCCNIEVSEPKGTEVMCQCGEWCQTK